MYFFGAVVILVVVAVLLLCSVIQEISSFGTGPWHESRMEELSGPTTGEMDYRVFLLKLCGVVFIVQIMAIFIAATWPVTIPYMILRYLIDKEWSRQ